MARALSTSSTEITSVYTVGKNPRRRLAELLPAAGAESVRNSEFKQGERIPGTRYRVLGLLGVGGMGSVYEVEHTELGKRFVLKALLRELAAREDLVARLRNEQRALGRLEHPNIVTVTDAGVTSANVPYFVMERLDGETLGARLKRTRRVPIPDALSIAHGVLEGLSAAHEIGVVHRDIKPQNILLVGGARPKILDFGVAKMGNPGNAITVRGVAVGTPRYMSPEQASGESVDGRSDLYAVGLLLFEAIAGAGPFDDVRDANEMLLAHLGRPAPRLAAVAHGVTQELDELVARLLAKDPAGRPPTARAATVELRAVAVRYGFGTRQDAMTPGADASMLTQPFGMQVALPPAPTTHADGVAARRAGAVRGSTTDEMQTLAQRSAATTAHTWIDDWGTEHGGSRHPPSTAAATTHVDPVSPITRTEILSVVGPASDSVEATRTAVPFTPTDGSRTLDPAGKPGLAAGNARLSRRRRLTAAAALAGVLLLGAVSLWALRATPPSAELPKAAPAQPKAATTAPAAGPTTAAPAPVVPAPVVPGASSWLPGAAPAPGSVTPPTELRATVDRPAAPGASPPARTASAAASTGGKRAAAAIAAGSATASSSVPRTSRAKRPEPLKIPAGLPGSGL